ncbi:hypothetical protein Scep_029501 [Stephania cephalantha]|uniref:Reverse transcriptase zinc-binding domain-containing protein n=1 Tax=Stephania cephalantha TaxID=152367 RepID=A0AAP0E0S6_9MAGN
MWGGDHRGIYTVKSSYKSLMGTINGSEVVNGVDFWLGVWNLGIRPSVKNFLWRAALDILLTTCNLNKRRVPISLTCSVCGGFKEDVHHVLLSCSTTAACWAEARVEALSGDQGSFVDWLGGLFKQSTKNKMEVVAMIAWNIWNNRNSIVWKNQAKFPYQVVNYAKSHLQAWKQARNRRLSIPNGAVSTDMNQWSRLEIGYV